MASPAPTPALHRAAVERLLSLLQPQHSLPLTFMYPSDSEEKSECLLQARAGGFMAVVPESEQIVEFLATWVDAEGAPVALSHPASLPMETSRRRLLGEARALLVDVPWSRVLHFRKAARVRVTAGPAATIFQVDGNTARPVRAAAAAAADTWLAAEGDDLAEYLTAVEPEELPSKRPRACRRGVASLFSEAVRMATRVPGTPGQQARARDVIEEPARDLTAAD